MDAWEASVWALRGILAALVVIRVWHLANGRVFAREELTGRLSDDRPYLGVEAGFLALSFLVVDPFFRWWGMGALPLSAAHALFLATIVIHELGHAAQLYRSMAFHFGAHTSISACIGVLVFFGLFHADLPARAYFSTLGVVFAIGVVWEYFEMYGTEYMDTQAWYHNWDMILDVAGNTLGGLIAVLAGHVLVTGGLALW